MDACDMQHKPSGFQKETSKNTGKIIEVIPVNDYSKCLSTLILSGAIYGKQPVPGITIHPQR